MSWISRVFGKIGNRKSKYISPSLVEKPVLDTRPNCEIEKDERRQRSETRLRGEGVPLNPDFPDPLTTDDLTLRSAKDVADRLLALTLVAMKADGMDHDVMLEIVRERDAHDAFTERELEFIMDPEPSEEAMSRYCRRFESAWTLVWALRLVREPLSTPRENCDADRLIEIVRDTPELNVRSLRDANSVLDKLDLFQGYDWAVKHALKQGKPPPSQLNACVAIERYRALAWLTCQRDWENPRQDIAA